ncbi:CAP domain-containing protein [Haloechinothrix salitolerans]|uniref:CAP domain-containing protein n=1 Tax=Haloechinothrix salitolerans TaxID=926830 RepID=A0ABW2BSM7_9PSEU
MTYHRAHRSRALAALLGVVLGGVTAGGYTIATGQTDIGAAFRSLSAEIALADAPNNGGAGAVGTGPSPVPTPVTTSDRQPARAPVETTSAKAKPKRTPKPTTTSPTTTSSAPSPTRTTERTRQLTVTPEVTTSQSTSKTSERPTMTERAVRLVNDVRADHGCGAVSVDERIERAANKHSTDMAERGYFSHDTPEGVGFAERIENEGYPSPGAENIAKGYRTAEDVMEGWMNSDGHRANILNCDLNTIGIGLDTNGWLWTQDFGY